MASVSFFTDKLSAETRIQIYKYIFGPGEVARRKEVTPKAGELSRSKSINPAAPKKEGTIATAIFAVNKATSAEALETFYNTKVILLTPVELYEALKIGSFRDLIRSVEIAQAFNNGSSLQLIKALHDLQTLPRIRSISILSEYFHFMQQSEVG